ncbi:MAG: hypothetical protein U9Q82_05930 [Chloroflexota bacterium]|nr:hypothetical protein [Chloroflexota bacterium]
MKTKKNYRYMLLCCCVCIGIILSGCNLFDGEGVLVQATSTPEEKSLLSLSPTEESVQASSTPTQTLTPTAIIEVEAVITASSLWVRSGPGTEYVMIAGVKYDDTVMLTGRTADSSWLLCQRGWVFGIYVESEGDISTLPVLYDFDSEAPMPTQITPTPQPET